MAVSWITVGRQLEQAVSGVIGDAWPTLSAGASTQFAAVIAAGKQIEQNRASMQRDEYDTLRLMQQRALEGVLQTYVGVSINVAEQAAAAAWAVVTTALKTAYPALGFL